MACQHDLTARAVLRRSALVPVLGSLAALALCTQAIAGPPPKDPIPPTPNLWGYGYGANQPGSSGTGSPGNSGGASSGGATNASASGPSAPPICGGWRLGIQACPPFAIPTAPAGPAGGAPAVTPAQLAITTWQTLPIPLPEVSTAPPRGSDGLVGLAEWFWVTNWTSHTGTATAGAVWAQVTAKPTTLSISPGQGQASVSCPGPGTAYNPSISAVAQHPTCSYQYTRSSAGMPGSAYTVTVTVTWGGTWVGSGGAGGVLPPLTRTTSFQLRVAEAQALTGG